MKTVVYESILEIKPEEWDALNDGNPFQSHAFFAALELSKSVGAHAGWIPFYFVLRLENDANPDVNPDVNLGETRVAQPPENKEAKTSGVEPFKTDAKPQAIACAAAFLKTHSMGEFVYDFSWAKEAERYGIQYYPKMTLTSPFSPVTGSRIHALNADARDALLGAIIQFSRSLKCHGVHSLFHDLQEYKSSQLLQEHFALRSSFQYQWENQNYASFDDFLSHLRSRRRKEIRRERRAVQNEGITLQAIPGAELKDADVQRIADFYRTTCERYTWGNAYLSEDFFKVLVERIPQNITFFTALKKGGTADERTVAGAFCLHSKTHLYGRYWGYSEHIPFLHFETCLYTPIEWAITHKISVFEPGAGGEHKFSRGFLPTKTYSSHLHFHPGFHDALARFCVMESNAVDEEIRALRSEESPYHRG